MTPPRTNDFSAALKRIGKTARDIGSSVVPPVSDQMVWAVARGAKKSGDGRVETAIDETIRAAGMGPMAPDRKPARRRSSAA